MTLVEKYAAARRELEGAAYALTQDPQGDETWRAVCAARARCLALARCGA
jgi:hypothetical protein